MVRSVWGFFCLWGFFWFFLIFFFFPRDPEVKGAINLSVLADANGEAAVWDCYASLSSSTISIRLAIKHLPNPVSFHGQLQLPQKSV